MEPHETSPISPQGGPERFPSTPNPEVGGFPRVPEQAPQQQPTPEQAPRYESHEQLNGQGAGNAAPAMPAPMMPQPTAPPAAAPVTPVNDPTHDNPLVADDVDVIEKEWVDRAKKIIQQTKDDPYQKEQEVSKLQADYLEKRFGVQVKLPQA